MTHNTDFYQDDEDFESEDWRSRGWLIDSILFTLETFELWLDLVCDRPGAYEINYLSWRRAIFWHYLNIGWQYMELERTPDGDMLIWRKGPDD